MVLFIRHKNLWVTVQISLNMIISTIRERRQQVADFLKTQGRLALSSIAEATGLSRSPVHRHQPSTVFFVTTPQSLVRSTCPGLS
jgi:hypothetical protein